MRWRAKHRVTVRVEARRFGKVAAVVDREVGERGAVQRRGRGRVRRVARAVAAVVNHAHAGARSASEVRCNGAGGRSSTRVARAEAMSADRARVGT